MTLDSAVRKWVAMIFMYGGWATAVAVGIFATSSFDPGRGQFAPEWVSLVFISAVGVGIAAGSAVSRIRLADTIVGAFQAGFQSGNTHRDSKEHK